MAVLGSGGRLELRREAPSPCVILPEDLTNTGSKFEIHCEGYWPGDKVVISNPEGLPIFDSNGNPQRWDGVASYFGSSLYVADNRDQITADTDQFYKSASEEYPTGEAGNDSNTPKTEPTWFYYRGDGSAGDSPQTSIEGYLCIDPLGRAQLYSSRCEGMNCCGTKLLDFGTAGSIDFDFIVINPAGSAEYQNALTECFGEIGEYIFNDIAENDNLATYDPNRKVDSICNDPPKYLKPTANPNTEAHAFNNADVQPRNEVNTGPHPLWTVLCEIKNWSLNLDAPSVDTTGVGEKFGNSVKSLVSGGGSAEFFIDKKCYETPGSDNGNYLMRLLLMTQMDGCRANAKFWMITGNDDNTCKPNCEGTLSGGMWYETDILVVQNAINLRPDELIAGTANFVTTGEIKLQIGAD